jgi:hypothetical protein
LALLRGVAKPVLRAGAAATDFTRRETRALALWSFHASTGGDKDENEQRNRMADSQHDAQDLEAGHRCSWFQNGWAKMS